jgi:hypothetical protein
MKEIHTEIEAGVLLAGTPFAFLTRRNSLRLLAVVEYNSEKPYCERGHDRLDSLRLLNPMFPKPMLTCLKSALCSEASGADVARLGVRAGLRSDSGKHPKIN